MFRANGDEPVGQCGHAVQIFNSIFIATKTISFKEMNYVNDLKFAFWVKLSDWLRYGYAIA